jgi:ATP-dependent DNA helicase DinG
MTAAEVLSAGGPLAKVVENFKPRQAQQSMAEHVAETLANHGTLICEAGTGTGKTFAYLVPALLSGKKVLISTGTKNLQDQLFHRDLPLLRQALAVPVQVALLKGRANYLCLHRLEQAQEDSRSRPRAVPVSEIQRIASWAGSTRSGDIAELTDVPESSPVWPQVTSTTDNCLGQECAFFSDCHVVKARREAAAADVVVVNHHLFLADMALRDEGFGEVLPGAEAVVFDEAHQLPETASRFFGTTLSSRQLLDLARDSIAAQLEEAPDFPKLREAAEGLESAAREFRLALGVPVRRAAWQVIAAEPSVTGALARLQEALNQLKTYLQAMAERGKELENCSRRVLTLLARLALFFGEPEQQAVRWFETTARGFLLYVTPLDISQPFQARIAAYKSAWIFTSATLAIGDDFSHFKSRIGIGKCVEARWDSPFDFARQAMLYLPRIDRDPRDFGYTEAVVEAALPVIEASRGRAFLLFTSHKALQLAESLLRGRIAYPLLTQGEAPKADLLARFRRAGNAVLLGTNSFWEGVDVRGEALSCVIIDKLPFASPDDPVMQARIQALRDRGENPFMDFQVPEAVILLKQGVGRLIRDEHDRGVLMLCDPRLLGKSYGRVFLQALPAMQLTREVEDVEQFFSQESA